MEIKTMTTQNEKLIYIFEFENEKERNNYFEYREAIIKYEKLLNERQRIINKQNSQFNKLNELSTELKKQCNELKKMLDESIIIIKLLIESKNMPKKGESLNESQPMATETLAQGRPAKP